MVLWLFLAMCFILHFILKRISSYKSLTALYNSQSDTCLLHSNTQLQVNLKVCDNSEHMAHQICHKNTFKHCSIVHTNTTVTNIQYWLLSSWAAWSVVACNPPDTANTLMFQCSNLACRFQADNANKLGPAARPARSTVSDEGFLCSGSSRGRLKHLQSMHFYCNLSHMGALQVIKSGNTKQGFPWTILSVNQN